MLCILPFALLWGAVAATVNPSLTLTADALDSQLSRDSIDGSLPPLPSITDAYKPGDVVWAKPGQNTNTVFRCDAGACIRTPGVGATQVP